MRYLLAIYGDETAMPDVKADGNAKYQMNPAYAGYTEAMKKAGVWLAGDRLRPTALATTVRLKDGKTELLNGPYAETKEQLGGYYIIEAPDLDAALAWAARCPGAGFGAIEVRPIWDMQ